MSKYMQTGRIARISSLATIVAVAGAVALTAMADPALAQRDPAYASARDAGQIGEKMDGYLGIVDASTPELRRTVNDINIKRKALYAQKAREQHATLEEYAFTSGCVLISQTKPGEMYQAPGGEWKTRTSFPPERDSRCP